MSKKRGERPPGKFKILDIYKGIRKPTPKPTHVQDDRPSRTKQKSEWKRESEDN